MSLIGNSIRRPVTVSMCVVAVSLFGLVSLDRLALNLLPDISYPSLTIRTEQQDAAPEEIENLITRPVEEAVGVVPGLTRLSSVSRPGESEVVIEFAWGTNMDLATLDVREKLDFVQLPRDAKRPVIQRFDPSFDPILRIELYGGSSLSGLRHLAEKQLKKSLESTQGVAAIKVVGGLEEQIRIEIDEAKLAKLGIPITEVTGVLARENMNQASGSLYDQDANYLVRMLNQFRSVEEINRIIVREVDGRRVLLNDVAHVWRGAKDREIIARLNGQESVELAVYKEGDANAVLVAEEVGKRLAGLEQAKFFPEGVKYEVVFNQADFIRSAIENVLWAAISGGLLATFILFLFLRQVGSTVIIALAIPVSVLATFALMYQTGISLNIMSLGGVALGVGMLVDNSIVVLESVDRHRRGLGSLALAVERGSKEVGRAVTASTLTSVAVFLPLVFVEGIAGQLFKDQALTITYCLLASLAVALSFVPMLLAIRAGSGEVAEEPAPVAEAPLSENRLARMGQLSARTIARGTRAVTRFLFSELVVVLLADLRRFLRAAGRLIMTALGPAFRVFDRGFDSLVAAYPPVLRWALDHKGTVAGLVICLVLAGGALGFRTGAELIPPLTQGEFSFEVELPKGRPLTETDRVMNALETKVAAYPEVKVVFASIGGSNRNQFAQGVEEKNFGQLYVVMKEKSDKAAELNVIERLREELRQVPEVSYSVSRPTLFSFKTPIEVEVYAFDLGTLKQAADRVAGSLRNIRGLSDIRSTAEFGNPEVHIRFDREKLARLGLDETQVSNIVRNNVRGDVASLYREEDKQIEILVRANEDQRKTIDDLRNLVINRRGAGGGNPGGATGENPGSASGANPNPAARDPLAPENFEGGSRQPAATGREARQPAPPAIRLGSVAEVTVERGPAEIRRVLSQRAAVVSANLSGRALSSVTEEIQTELNRIRAELPPETTVQIAGQNEELRASFDSLLFALGLAIFLVYMVMASQFESFLHPFVILFTVPLALVGVVFALAATGTTISVMVLLGVIILAGIVVNNAIVLIDYANQLREQGYSKRDALTEAGRVRLRPIAMTTLTTILGLTPMALGFGEGAEVRAPMAITVMGGLAFATLLTLILIPVVYDALDRRQYKAVEPEAEGSGTLPANAALRAGD